MKKSVFVLFVFPLFCTAQQIVPGVVNVSGGSASGGYYRYDWSVGELCLIDTYNQVNLILENGFLHPGTERPGGNTNNFFSRGDVMIFPNPVYTIAEINFTVQQPGKVSIMVRDVLGKLHISKQFNYNGVGQIEKLDVQRFPAGTYFLDVLLIPTDPAQPQRKGVFKLTHLTN
jgi:hypothetical protein